MLTDTKVKTAKAKEKAYKLADSNRLYLYITTKGYKSWRYDYTLNGKSNTFTIGEYPAVSLAQAREIHAELRAKVKSGIDPREEIKAQARIEKEKEENKFQNIALEWYEKQIKGSSAKHEKTVIQRLEKNVFPFIGDKEINSITIQELKQVFQIMEKRGVISTAHKVLGLCERIFTYAIITDRAKNNIALSLRGTLQKKPKEKHLAHITNKKELGQLMQALENNTVSSLIVRTALQIIPYIFVRPSELCQAEWQEIDFERDLWIIPAEKMKMGRKHIVPLPRQVVALLKDLSEQYRINEYVFPSVTTKRNGKPINSETLLKGLRSLGYSKEKVCIHGFRHTASTLLNELGYNSDHIEKQLAHEDGKGVRATYNHAEYLEERRKLMQEWADYLDSLKTL